MTTLFLFLLFFPLITTFFILIISELKTIKFYKKDYNVINLISIYSASFCFLLAIYISLFSLQQDTLLLQYAFDLKYFPFLNLTFSLGFDALSLSYISLTAFLIFICVLISYNKIKENYKLFFSLLFFIEFLLFIVFSTMDLLCFYIFFESLLIPFFILIGRFGSGDRKIRAGLLFFFYTFFGSIFMLFGIIYIYTTYHSTNYEYLLTQNFSFIEEKFLWLAFFLSFAIKLPLFPFHIWLPEAHVEAPTTGSILLAGILLKMGVYGIIRFLIPLFPYASIYYTPLVIMLALLGIIYTSLTAIRQVDLKRIIAYTSVAHMNLVILSIFTFSTMGFIGGVFQSISHGFVSSALFLLIGIIYERYHKRSLQYYSGLVVRMPLYITFFMFFSLANMAFPLTSSFVGEFLILFSIYCFSIPITFFASLGMILGGGYSLWLLNRISFGNLQLKLINANDIDSKEFFALFSFTFFVLLFGIYPTAFFSFFEGFFSLYSIF